jgi:hypothetical protein
MLAIALRDINDPQREIPIRYRGDAQEEQVFRE